MNKNRKLFFIFGIISFLIGYAMIFMCSLNEKFDIQLTRAETIMIGIGGIIFVMGGIVCLVLYVKNFFNQDENLRIGEKDERNIMIRGKAAEKSMLITALSMLIVECVLMCIGDLTAVLLVAITIFLCSFVQILLICYYQKKY